MDFDKLLTPQGLEDFAMPPDSETVKQTAGTRRGWVFNQILNSIFTAEFRGGDRLVEQEIAATIGVSRTPVREAFSELAAIGLIDGAARVLGEQRALILYGPWLVEGIETAASNLAFDADLRSRNPHWGLRRVNDFAAEAEMRGFGLAGERRMPANNTMLKFTRTGVSA